jgi:hypothetical protein
VISRLGCPGATAERIPNSLTDKGNLAAWCGAPKDCQRIGSTDLAAGRNHYCKRVAAARLGHIYCYARAQEGGVDGS